MASLNPAPINLSGLECKELALAKNNIHYFADVCLKGSVYKQCTYLLNSYTRKNTLAITPRQSGTTLSHSIYALWELLFTDNRIVYSSMSIAINEYFIARTFELYNSLPEHFKLGLVRKNKSQLENLYTGSTLKVLSFNPVSFRGWTFNTVIIDSFHFCKHQNFLDVWKHTLPVAFARKARVIMGTCINPSGWSLAKFIIDSNIEETFNIKGFDYTQCTGFSPSVLKYIEERLSTDPVSQAEYLCIDKEGISYVE